MKYIINKCFELRDVFDNGQCFRWDENPDKSYTGVFHNIVLNVQNVDCKTIFEGISLKPITQNEFEKEIIEYFDLNRDYNSLKKEISKIDSNLSEAVKYGSGLRLLNQDLFETIISFIISANNNIPRIKGIISRMCNKYGQKIVWQGNEYYTFPSIDDLVGVNVEDFRSLGMGFRDKYVYNAVQFLKANPNLQEVLNGMETIEAEKTLEQISGVGPKVADCILLFSDVKKLDVFPIDVWVRRVMNELYIHNPDEKKVTNKEIMKVADEKFGNLKGLAQQYLFYWRREK